MTSNGTDAGVGGSAATDCSGVRTTVAPGTGAVIDLDDSYGSIYLDIEPHEQFCTSGKASQLWKSCSADAECDSNNFACSAPTPGGQKVCQGGTNSGEDCSNSNDCPAGDGVCETSLECNDGTDIDLSLSSGGTKTVTGTFIGGHLTACVDLTGVCLNGHVTYCGNNQAIDPNPSGTPTYKAATLEGCGAQAATTCLNQVGALCCGLTQGAYGAWNSVATCQGDNCNPIDPTSKGWIPALFALGTNIFEYTGNRNATTIGQSGKSVSIGTGVDDDFPTDLSTLVAYLPATTKAGKFNGLVSGNQTYTTPSSIPDAKPGGSRGEGGGVLSGNGMACGLNIALSGTIAGTDGTDTFTPSGFGDFDVGGTPPGAVPLICTRRAGEDKILGTADDVCQAFQYPNCVAGLTVSEIKAEADAFLSTGTSPHGCTASQLNVALDNINNQFDQCGEIIDCAAAGASGPGITPNCPALPD